MTMAGFYKLTLAACDQDPAGASIISFDIPPALADIFDFLPGQYLTLRADLDGEDIRRPYSICSSPQEARRTGCIAVGIRQIEDGRFSQFAKGLAAGDQLEVMPPQGRFTLDKPRTGQHLLLAAGSGITPILSIATTLLENYPDLSIHLLWGNRHSGSIMLKPAVDGLKNRFMGRFSLNHILSRESGDQPLFEGRLDSAKLDQLAAAGLLDADLVKEAWICGPGDMSADCASWLAAHGLSDRAVHTELFTPAAGSQPAIHRKPASQSPEKAKQVRVIIDGTSRQFDKMPGQSVIEAARAVQISLPWSCANGMCATCRCQLAQGAGQMRQNFSLDADELAKGFVLACQIEPETDSITLDFDQA